VNSLYAEGISRKSMKDKINFFSKLNLFLYKLKLEI